MTDDCENDLRRQIAVLTERLRGVETARELQAKEYARRLEELNHAHREAKERNALFVTREAYDVTVREWTIWRAGVDKELSEMRGSKTGQHALFAYILAGLALLASAANWYATIQVMPP